MRQRIPEGSGCFGSDSGSGRCPDGISLAAWLRLGPPEGVCFQRSSRCVIELKMGQVRSLNTRPAGAGSVPKTPAQLEVGHLAGLCLLCVGRWASRYCPTGL